MEVQLKYETLAKCHPEDVWHVFSRLEEWQKWTDVFGNAGWVEGEPWRAGSRFFVELLFPKHIDLEVLIIKCDPNREVVFLPHGAGYAAQQWIRFLPDGYGDTLIQTEEHFVGSEKFSQPEVQQMLSEMIKRWFDALSVESHNCCETYAL